MFMLESALIGKSKPALHSILWPGNFRLGCGFWRNTMRVRIVVTVPHSFARMIDRADFVFGGGCSPGYTCREHAVNRWNTRI